MKIKKSFYNMDKKFEEKSTDYILDSGVLEEHGIEDIEIVLDKDEQKKGKDLKGVYKGDRISIDIKSIGALIPTFCQEMMNVNSGKVGWLVNPDIETDYYFYAYHVTDEGGGNYYTGKKLIAESTDCIVRNVYIMVSRKKLIRAIEEEMGITLDEHTPLKMLDDIEKLEGKPIESCSGQFIYTDDGKMERKHGSHSMWISLSSKDRIYEQPLNIIVSRNVLARIAEFTVDENAASNSKLHKEIRKEETVNTVMVNGSSVALKLNVAR